MGKPGRFVAGQTGASWSMERDTMSDRQHARSFGVDNSADRGGKRRKGGEKVAQRERHFDGQDQGKKSEGAQNEGGGRRVEGEALPM